MKSFRLAVRSALASSYQPRFALPVLIYPTDERDVAVKKFRHRCYMRRWNPAHKTSIRRTWNKWAAKNRSRLIAANKRINRNSHPSFGARRAWTAGDDALLLSGQTESQLVQALGRTIRSIQRRKHALRQKEVA